MATWRVNNSTSLGGEVCSPWQADHTYATGARCVCTVAYATTAARAFVYEVTSGGGGKSHATTQPSWPTTVGNTVVDNAITWTCRSPSDGSWDNASCYLQYVMNYAANASGGDTVLVHYQHNETTSTLASICGSTSVSSRTTIICVNKADDSLSSGAIIYPNLGWSTYFEFYGHCYSYGVHYKADGYGLRFGRDENPGTVEYWTIEGSGPTSDILTVSNSIIDGRISLTNGVSVLYGCTSVLEVINGGINISGANGFITGTFNTRFIWRNGKLTATSELTRLISSTYGIFTFEDVDLSALCTGATARGIIGESNGYKFIPNVTLTRCKLPSGAGFSVFKDSPPTVRPGWYVKLRHCASDNAVYRFWEESSYGYTKEETTIVRSGGASDGTTPISAKMVSTANVCENDSMALKSPPITGWTSSTTSKTFTVEGVWDSATNIQDDEIWMELEYPANNTDGLGALVRDCCAVLGTPADQTASTATWTTTGMTNPNKFKLSVTVTPGKAGPICARVYLAKPSTTVYIDPLITES